MINVIFSPKPQSSTFLCSAPAKVPIPPLTAAAWLSFPCEPSGPLPRQVSIPITSMFLPLRSTTSPSEQRLRPRYVPTSTNLLPSGNELTASSCAERHVNQPSISCQYLRIPQRCSSDSLKT